MTSPAVQFDQLDSVTLAVIRRQASASELSRVVPQCCGLVWNAVRAQQARACRHVAIYWDGSIRLEVGVELYGAFAEEGEVVRSATPAGPVAWATHLGPYGGLGAAHEAVRQWCRANNRQLAGPNWEIYGHWQSEWNTNPSQIRTDVYYLLASSRRRRRENGVWVLDRPGPPIVSRRDRLVGQELTFANRAIQLPFATKLPQL